MMKAWHNLLQKPGIGKLAYLPAKVIQRRNQSVVLSGSQMMKSLDFLACVGAHQSVFEFEDSRIQRDFMNNLTRLDNCVSWLMK